MTTLFNIQGRHIDDTGDQTGGGSISGALLQVVAPADGAFTVTPIWNHTDWTGAFDFHLGDAVWLLDGAPITEAELSEIWTSAFHPLSVGGLGQFGIFPDIIDYLAIHDQSLGASFFRRDGPDFPFDTHAEYVEWTNDDDWGNPSAMLAYDWGRDEESDPIPYAGFAGASIAPEELTGTPVVGGPDDDVLYAETGPTIFVATPGDDVFLDESGDGGHSAIYAGPRDDYVISEDLASGQVTVTHTGDSPIHQGEDVMNGVETLVFTDDVVNVLAPPPDPDPEPDPEPDPLPPGTGPQTLDGTIRDTTGAPLEDAWVNFTPTDAEAPTRAMDSGPDGGFALGLQTGAQGRLNATRDHDPDTDPDISADDALDVLRMAVGLDPSFGPASAENFVAADMNQDGQIDASDALDVLRVAVGLESENAPRWVFFDANTDWDGLELDRNNSTVETGIDIAAMQSDQSADMTGILLGSMQEYA